MLLKGDHRLWMQTWEAKELRVMLKTNLLSTVWLSQMRANTMANLWTGRGKVLELALGWMAQCMRACGSMVSDKVMESSLDLVKALTKDNGLVTRKMVKASYISRMVTSSTASGSKMSWMAALRSNIKAFPINNSQSSKTACKSSDAKDKWAALTSFTSQYP